MVVERDLQPSGDGLTTFQLKRGQRFRLGGGVFWIVPVAAVLAAVVIFAFETPGQQSAPPNQEVQRRFDDSPETTGSVNRSAELPRATTAMSVPSPLPAPAQPTSRFAGQADGAAPAAPPRLAAPEVDTAKGEGRLSGQRVPPTETGARGGVRPGPRPLALPVDVIGAYLASGEAKLSAGDVATARLYFDRVARAGDERGALGMARTYDPAVLAALPLIGPHGDADLARKWYQEARSSAASIASKTP